MITLMAIMMVAMLIGGGIFMHQKGRMKIEKTQQEQRQDPSSTKSIEMKNKAENASEGQRSE